MVYKTVSTTLTKEKLEELKKKTGESTNKESLARAVYHYLYCPYIEEGQWERQDEEPSKRTKRGRRPFYIEKYFKDERKE